MKSTFSFTYHFFFKLQPKDKIALIYLGGGRDFSDAQLSATVKDQLKGWWGEQVDSWDLLRIYRYVYVYSSVLSTSTNTM